MVDANLFRNDAALQAFHLTRYAFGLERLDDQVLEHFFQPGRAVLGGPWNALEVRNATARPDSTEWHLEQRVTYGFGPLSASMVEPGSGGLWEALSSDHDRPLMAYAEIRFSELLLASGESAFRRCLEYTVKSIGQGASPMLRFAAFAGMGHDDLKVILCSDCLDDLMTAMLKIRKLMVGNLLDAHTGDFDQGARHRLDAYRTNHLCRTTGTSFGFFSPSFGDLESFADQLKDVDLKVRPTILACIEPGHEGAASYIAGFDDAVHLPELEVITGTFDMRLRYPEARSQNQKDIFRWLMKAYRMLQRGRDGSRSRSEHIRTLHTTWGIAPEDDPPAPHSAAPYVFCPKPAQMEDTSNVPPVLDDFAQLYFSLTQSAVYSRYLADVGVFFMKLRAEAQHARPEDIERIARRMTFVLISRLVGVTPGTEPQLVLGHTTGLQKLALALNWIANRIVEPFPSNRPALLVGLTGLDTARTTVLRRPAPQLAIIELPAVDDFRRTLFSLLHEVSHTIQLDETQEISLRAAIAAEVIAHLESGVALKGLGRLELGAPPLSNGEDFRGWLSDLERPSRLARAVDVDRSWSATEWQSFEAIAREIGFRAARVQSLASETRADLWAAAWGGGRAYALFIADILKPAAADTLDGVRLAMVRRLILDENAGSPSFVHLEEWLRAFGEARRRWVESHAELRDQIDLLSRILHENEGRLDGDLAYLLLDLARRALATSIVPVEGGEV